MSTHTATGRHQVNPRILVVADDFTGGNACGALFAEAGLRTITLSTPNPAEPLGRFFTDHDVVVVNAESRHLAGHEAAELTTAVISAAGEADLVSCRIDTTLRGNVGATAEAALTARSRSIESAGGRDRLVMGLCIPAFPTAGRTTVQGRQLLDGRLLEDTELARDVRSPVRTSDVESILTSGTGLSCRLIDLSTILDGREAIREMLCQAISDRADVIIADALTPEHIDLVGQAVAEITEEIADPAGGSSAHGILTRTGLNNAQLLDWVSIDPGPGSLSLARALLPPRPYSTILGISGSATEVTRAQLAALAEDPRVAVIRTVLDRENLPDIEATLARVRKAGSARAIIVATVLDSGDLLDLTDDQSRLTTQRLGQIAAAVMESIAVSGLYTTGGDVTAMVMRALGAEGLEVEKEIIPLAVGGRLAGGLADGLPIVTKGGLIGDAETAARCLDHLRTASAPAHPQKRRMK